MVTPKGRRWIKSLANRHALYFEDHGDEYEMVEPYPSPAVRVAGSVAL